MKIPVYDFLMDPEEEKKLCADPRYKVTDPEILEDLRELKPLNIKVVIERKDK